MKSLLYIANLRLPTEKAYGIQIAKMCEAFALEGLDATLVYPFRKNQEKGDIFSYYSIRHNFKIKKIRAPDFYLPGQFDRIAVHIKGVISALFLCFYAINKKADIIYSRDELPLFLLSFFRKNLVFEAHRFSKSRGLFYRRFKNKIFKIVVITGRLKGDFIKIGFRPENILVAPDGVDLEEFNINISKENARIQADLPLNKKIVMYTGHLFEWKGVQTLLQVARNFQFSIFNFQHNERGILFVFAGGTDRDVERLREKAEGLENVLILGHKPHKDIPLFLKAADVLVLPNSAKEEMSKFYTSPLKLFEYMASGRPIIASGLPSLREILNQHNAILVKPDDASDLSAGIKTALDNQALSSRISAKGFEDVKKYTWQERSKQIWTYLGF